MKSITQFLESLFSSSSERLSNPIISSVFFSWVLINWDIILVILFQKSEILTRIELVKTMVNWIDGIAIPVAAAAVYVMVLPFLQNWIEQKLEKVKLHRVARINRADKQNFNQKIQVAKEQAAYNLALTGANDLENLKNQNEALNKELSTLKKELADNQTEISDLSVENSELKSTLGRREREIFEYQQDESISRDKKEQIKKLGFDKYLSNPLLIRTIASLDNDLANNSNFSLNEYDFNYFLKSFPELFKVGNEPGSLVLTDKGRRFRAFLRSPDVSF